MYYLFVFLSSSLFATSLSLEGYLKQVQEKHDGLRAASETSAAFLERSREGELLTSPTLFADALFFRDDKETANPGFQGTRTTHTEYQLGVSKLTTFGLAAKLYYGFSHTILEGTQPTFVPQPDFFEAHPTLEVSQSLLKNGFGSQTRAIIEASQAKAMASHYAEAYKLKMILAQAEVAYWRLVIARETVDIQATILKASERLKDWNANRTRLALADKADLLQSQAGLQARNIEHGMAVNERASAERGFNTLRGSADEALNDALEPLDADKLLQLKIPEKAKHREDVLAAKEAANALAAAALIGKENNSPDLKFIGSASLNGRDARAQTSLSDSFKTQNPTFAFGLKFSTPLDFGLIQDDRRAYEREKVAAELDYRRKMFEEERDYHDIQKRFTDAKNRLEQVQALQKSQSQKLEYERERLKRGRSVTYQVLLFEQDYANAQALRLRTQAEILSLHAQLKTFMTKETK